MLAIPILEIRNGVCSGPHVEHVLNGVSLNEPVIVARAWSDAGFSTLYLVDHDAVSEIGSNAAILEDVIRDGAAEILANTGVQSADGIHRLLDAGAARVVVGTRGIVEPEWFGAVTGSNAGVLILETTVRERRVVSRGWSRSIPLDIFDVIEDLNGLPLGGLIIAAAQTEKSRGVMDLGILEDIVEASDFPVFAAGAVGTLGDLRALEHRGLAGAVFGAASFADLLDARSIAREFGE